MYFQNALVAEQTLTDELIKQIDDSARAEAETSAQFAEASPYPTVEDIKKDVYWEIDNPADRKSQGALFFD
jgi:pyruvate dehydrogenase E1 component alpha subunit